MAQRNFWNFKDDDSTNDLNQRENGIINAGRYRGFDANISAGLNLDLVQTVSGVIKTIDATTTQQYGVWYTKQGVVITETDTITVPIAANPSGNPRIDLIVGQHEYVFTPGGAVATYVVITGATAPNPSPPSLTLPNTQVILGQLFVPAGMTSLTDAGVEYTPAPVPDFGGDGTIAHTDRTNNFEFLQQMAALERYAGIAQLGVSSASTTLELENASGDANGGLDFYVINPNSTPTGDYDILNLNPLVPPSGTDNWRRIQFYTPIALKLLAATFGRDYYIKAESTFSLIFTTGAIYVDNGDESALGRVNKFYAQQIYRTRTITTTTTPLEAATELVTLLSGFNFYILNNTATNNSIRGIQSTAAFDGASTDGGRIVLIPTEFALTFKAFDFTVPVGYKPIWTPNQNDWTVQGNGAIMLVEDEFYWRIVAIDHAWFDAGAPTFNKFPAPATVNFATTRYRYQIVGNRCHIEFRATGTAFTGGVTQILFQLPTGIVPANIGQIFAGYYSNNGGGGSPPYQNMCAEIFAGNQISVTPSPASPFPNITNDVFTFSVWFEI